MELCSIYLGHAPQQVSTRTVNIRGSNAAILVSTNFRVVNFLKMDLIEKRAAIKFCVKSGLGPCEMLDMMKRAYGEECLSKTTIFQWHKKFRKGRTALEDDERSGRPKTTTTDENV